MKLRTLAVIVVLLAVVVFAALNWAVITAPTPLSLGVTQVQAPLGLLLLGVTALLTLAFIAFIAYQQTAALLELRRTAKALDAQRALADSAEASRFTDLRTYLEVELRRLADQGASARGDLLARLDRLGEELGVRLSEVSNGLAAHLAEVEDKVDRALGPGPGAAP